jgi:predicted ATPase
LQPGITILVGPNGSGKTCILSALQFLRDVFRVGAAQALARQGGYRRVYHHGQSEISFCFEQTYGERTYRLHKIPCIFRWQITISQAGPDKIATIIHEKVEITGKQVEKNFTLFSLEVNRTEDKPKVKSYLCSSSEFGHDLFSSWYAMFGNKKKSQIASDFSSQFLQHMINRLRKNSDLSCFPRISQFDETLGDIYSSFMFLNEYNILPDVARAPTAQLPFAQMAPNGEAVSEVIDALANQRYHKLEQLRFMDFEESYPLGRPYWRHHSFHYSDDFIRSRRWRHDRESYSEALENINKQLSAAVRLITEVTVEIDPTSGKRFVVFKAGQDKFYPEEVSDGTIKWLCILVSLFVPFSRVYLIEEPENFLHPWMQQRLIEIMREQAKQNKTIFLLSSHSATILNAALPEELQIVRQSEEGTTLSAMTNINDIHNVLSKSDFHLGDLWVSGAIGGVPADE